MTRVEALKELMAQPDPPELPQRGHKQIYAGATSKVQMYSSASTPLKVAVEQWLRRFA